MNIVENVTNIYISASAKIIKTTAKKWYRLCSHKQCKTLLKDHLVRFKIISLYIYF